MRSAQPSTVGSLLRASHALPSGLDKLRESLHLSVIELREELGHILQLSIVRLGVELGEALAVFLCWPAELREEVVDSVGHVLAHAGLHCVLAVARLGEHLTDAGRVLRCNL